MLTEMEVAEYAQKLTLMLTSDRIQPGDAIRIMAVLLEALGYCYPLLEDGSWPRH